MSARIEYEHQGMRCLFLGRRQLSGSLHPPVASDLELVASGGLHLRAEADRATWRAGLTAAPRWAAELREPELRKPETEKGGAT